MTSFYDVTRPLFFFLMMIEFVNDCHDVVDDDGDDGDNDDVFDSKDNKEEEEKREKRKEKMQKGNQSINSSSFGSSLRRERSLPRMMSMVWSMVSFAVRAPVVSRVKP